MPTTSQISVKYDNALRYFISILPCLIKMLAVLYQAHFTTHSWKNTDLHGAPGPMRKEGSLGEFTRPDRLLYVLPTWPH